MSQIDWPFHYPAVVPMFAFRPQVAMLVRRAADHDAIEAVCQKIYSRYMDGLAFPRALQTFLDLAYTIDRVKVQVLGQNGPTDDSNLIMRVVALVWIDSASAGEKEATLVDDLTTQLKADETAANWFFPKVMNVKLLLDHKLATLEYVSRAFPIEAEKTLEALTQILPDWKIQADQLISEIYAMRKYGVKSCYFQDGLLHSPGEAWVFSDPAIINRNPHTRKIMGGENILAAIGLADRKAIQNVALYREESVGSLSHMQIVAAEVGAKLGFYLSSTGELVCMGGTDQHLTVRNLFRGAGKENCYEVVRLAQLMRAYDLVVPVEVARLMPQLPTPVTPVIGRIVNKLRRTRLVTPELLLPRLRSLDNMSMVVAELAREVERAIDDTVKRAKKGRHEVVWHIRRLLPGHKASPTAILRAKEEDVVLGENETFVRMHERGEGPTKSKKSRKAVYR